MKKESPLWSSISLLIGIVIAILALVRGRILLPLLLAVFALWLLWWLLTQALPLWRNNRAYTRFVNEAFLSRRRKVCTGVVRIGLKKAVSGSHEYCVATFTKIADFAGEDLAHIRAYADGFVAQIKDINAQRAQAGAAASSIIGDGDASHLELPDNGAHFALGAVIDGEREELPA